MKILAFETVRENLMDVGAPACVMYLGNEIRKERKRLRSLGREDADVINALARQRDVAEEMAAKRRRAIQEDNEKLRQRSQLQNDLVKTNELLKKKKTGTQGVRESF